MGVHQNFKCLLFKRYHKENKANYRGKKIFMIYVSHKELLSGIKKKFLQLCKITKIKMGIIFQHALLKRRYTMSSKPVKNRSTSSRRSKMTMTDNTVKIKKTSNTNKRCRETKTPLIHCW
jgi:hypothetical protein